MVTEIERAVEFYEHARQAEEQKAFNVAETDYLKSANLYQQIGEVYFMEAANVLNALTRLREARGNYREALCSAKHAEKILEGKESEISNPKFDQIRLQTWGLIAELYRQMQRDPEAEKILCQAFEYARMKFGEEDQETAFVRGHVGIPVPDIQGLE